MTLTEGSFVFYNNINGVITFVCKKYIVVDIPSVSNRNPARLLIFNENYKDVMIMETSEK